MELSGRPLVPPHRAKSLAMAVASAPVSRGLVALLAFAAAPLALACAKAAPEATPETAIAEPAPVAAASPRLLPLAPAAEPSSVPVLETQRFGAPIGASAPATMVALADVAKNAKSFKGKSIVTTGTVAAVCQERGCWMEIKDEGGDANVRMHGHAFFIPKSASGKKARVEGTVVLMKDGKECDEMAATGAQLELDATGVELM